MNQGTLIAIATRSRSRAPMVELTQADITVEEGVVGDCRGLPGPRQVTVLAADQWRTACAEIDADLPWTTRRANLLIDGLELAHTQDATLQIGDVVLKITGETDPCQRMDEACPGLCQALTPSWRGGVRCQVVSGGTVSPGAIVVLANSAPRAT